jgi:HEAT repeat protein
MAPRPRLVPVAPPPAGATGPRFNQGEPYHAPTLIKRVPQITTITAADVERDFAAAKTPGERASLAETIAAQRDPETFTILARLYAKEPVATVREALIAGLIEVDEEEHTPAKIALLGGALKKEPRNVRRAALDVLAQIDSPEAIALLKKAAKEDTDFQIREAAKAFLADQ